MENLNYSDATDDKTEEDTGAKDFIMKLQNWDGNLMERVVVWLN